MKIVQLLPELNEGGVERGVVELNREFVKLGLTSIVISNGGRLEADIAADGGRHICFDICSKNPLTLPWRTLGLRKLLYALSPDIVHARSRVPAWLAKFALNRVGPHFVTTVHGMNSINRYSRIMTTGERVICVSEVIRDYLLQHYPVDAEKLSIIQRGVDMNLFNPETINHEYIADFKQRFGLDGKYIVTSVGRVTYLKDYESFIRAIALCHKEIPEIIGVIVGGARDDKQEYLRSLKQLAKEQGIEERIIFTGSQDRMPEIHHLGDLSVNASLKMGNVGRTVTEALAMNTPVLATTFKGLSNLVKDGENGYIIETQSPDDLAEKIRMSHQRRVTETRSTVDPEFTLERMVTNTLSVYRSLQ